MLLHRCNSRRPLSQIKQSFPSFKVSKGIPEVDELFEKQMVIGRNESEDELVNRASLGIASAISQSGDATCE
jgi:hypothetical protein